MADKRLTNEDLAAAIEFARKGYVERTLLAMRTSLGDSMDGVLLNALTEIQELRAMVAEARDAARVLSARISDLGSFVDDSDPRVMATAGPVGAAEADLYVALGLDTKAAHAEMVADVDSRCAVCGWHLAESADNGCVRGNCSYRPRPEKLYAPARAAQEAGEK